MGNDLPNEGEFVLASAVSRYFTQVDKTNRKIAVKRKVRCNFLSDTISKNPIKYHSIFSNCFQRSMLMNGILEPAMGSILKEWLDSNINVYGSKPHAIGEMTIVM